MLLYVYLCLTSCCIQDHSAGNSLQTQRYICLKVPKQLKHRLINKCAENICKASYLGCMTNLFLIQASQDYCSLSKIQSFHSRVQKEANKISMIYIKGFGSVFLICNLMPDINTKYQEFGILIIIVGMYKSHVIHIHIILE